jgi:hypothetical protein
MEEIIGILITILISSGILGGAYIYFKDKLKYVAAILKHLVGTLEYMHQALDDDILTKEEIKQIVARLEELVEMIREIIGGNK